MSVLFYDDSPVFGGHEVMTLAGLEAMLSRAPEPLVFVASSANRKLLDRLREISHRYDHLQIVEVSWHSSKLEALRHYLFFWRSRALAKILAKWEPSLMVVVQGNIEHSSLGFFAAKLAVVKCMSYIPVPHSNAQMGAKFGWVRDGFCQRLFALPDAWMTITDEMARMLALRGASAPIHVVYNGVDIHRFCKGSQSQARNELKLPEGKVLLGVIGRVEFRQKQQDLLIAAVASEPELAKRCHLVFAGDGPDADRLREMLQSKGVSGTVLAWCDPAPLYRALDAVIIPSRYEGLPLVMLEALATGTMVMGSDRDGMKDVLPPSSRFAADSAPAMADCIQRWIREGMKSPSAELVTRVREQMSLAAFGTSFAGVIDKEKVNSSFPK